MTCKTCTFLVVPPTPSGRRIVRAGNAYRCAAPDPPLPPLPYSITSAVGFRWPPTRSWVTPGCGGACPTYVPLVPQ